MFQPSLPFPEIVARLSKLCQEKHTGNFYILNNGHLLGQVSLQNGEITSIIAQKKQGVEAIAILLGVENGGIAFAEGAVAGGQMALPPTADLLTLLEGASFTGSRSFQHEPRSARNVPNSHNSHHLTASQKTVLEQTLKEFIGPISNMICADHFRKVATLTAAIDALADEIPTPQAAPQFRERTRER